MSDTFPTFADKALSIDGQPTILYSGEVQHYRLPSEYWRDRLEKCKALGLNGVGVYFGWNFHSPAAGEYDFTSPDRDLGAFLDLAAELGLHVIVRPGPYVCNEWDLGAYPGWLLAEADGGGDWRTADPAHLDRCREWLKRVDAIIAPRQHGKGGSVVLYQVENEHFQGDAGFLDGLAEQIQADGIGVPLISNGGGSAFRCGSRLVTDGADIYTLLWEQWRWRGWFTMLQRQLPPDAPMMILEYRAGGHPFWGEKPIDEHTSPPEFMMAQTRMFIGLGANVTNFFVVSGGITPVGFGSDHNCTPYAEDGPLSHWGGIGRKAYRIRLLGEAIASVNPQLATAAPLHDLWGSDNACVEALVRGGEQGTFFFPVNTGDGVQTFRLKGPCGTVRPKDGEPLRIAPRTSQMYMADVDLGDGWCFEFCTAQLFSLWREGERLRLIVYGEPGQAGWLDLRHGSDRCHLEFTCREDVCRVTAGCGGADVDLFAVTESVAERTWLLESGEERVPLFGNLDLLRPGTGVGRGELPNGRDLSLLVPDRIALEIDGARVAGEARADDIHAYHVERPALPSPSFELGPAETRIETEAWLLGEATEDAGWEALPVLESREAALVNPGIYQYRAEFEMNGPLPSRLGFLSLAGVESTVYLNGSKLGVWPERRLRSGFLDGESRVDIEVNGALKEGSNQLDVVCRLVGRHNHGRPQYTGINRPVVLFDTPAEVELTRWHESPTVSRRWIKPELLAHHPEAAPAWPEVDLSVERSLPPPWGSEDWLSVRWYTCRCAIPADFRGKPLFLQLPEGSDSWLYVNGEFVDRADCDRTQIFDLTRFAGEEPVDLTIGLRYYWRGPFFLTAPPELVSFPYMIEGAWFLRRGSQGERENWLACREPWQQDDAPGTDARLWYRRPVTVSETEGLWAPIYVELEPGWQANATIYWNGDPIGLYSEVGPDRRFLVPAGNVRETNELAIAVDGLANPPRAGEVRMGVFAEQRPVTIGLV